MIKRPLSLQVLILLIGIMCMLLGSIALVGWYTSTVEIIQVLPLFGPLQYSAAVGCLLSGTGIGRAHCQKIIDLLEGNIWVTSEPGEGITFFITINK